MSQNLRMLLKLAQAGLVGKILNDVFCCLIGAQEPVLSPVLEAGPG